MTTAVSFSSQTFAVRRAVRTMSNKTGSKKTRWSEDAISKNNIVQKTKLLGRERKGKADGEQETNFYQKTIIKKNSLPYSFGERLQCMT